MNLVTLLFCSGYCIECSLIPRLSPLRRVRQVPVATFPGFLLLVTKSGVVNVAFLFQLSSLADQLKDLEELLQTKGSDLLHSPASTSTTHVPLSATESERQVRGARVCAHTIHM